MRRAALLLGLLLLLTACGSDQPPPSVPPAPVPTATPSPEAQGPKVHTDWSKLEEREDLPEPVGERWYETYVDGLIPGNYGGELVPYAGLRLTDDWPAREGGGCLYGLMTRSGTAVSDPVYSSVSRLNRGFWWDMEPSDIYPVLALGRAVPVTDGEYRHAREYYAFAAVDGAWCTEHIYRLYATGGRGIFAATDDGCVLLDQAGTELRSWTWADLGYSQEHQPPFNDFMETYIEWVGDGILLEENEEQARVLNLDTGEVETWTFQAWLDARDADGEGRDYDSTYRFDPYTAEAYLLEGDVFSGDPLVLKSADGEELVRIERPTWGSSLGLVDGLVEIVERDMATYQEKDGTVVFRQRLGIAEE